MVATRRRMFFSVWIFMKHFNRNSKTLGLIFQIYICSSFILRRVSRLEKKKDFKILALTLRAFQREETPKRLPNKSPFSKNYNWFFGGKKITLNFD